MVAAPSAEVDGQWRGKSGVVVGGMASKGAALAVCLSDAWVFVKCSPACFSGCAQCIWLWFQCRGAV